MSRSGSCCVGVLCVLWSCAPLGGGQADRRIWRGEFVVRRRFSVVVLVVVLLVSVLAAEPVEAGSGDSGSGLVQLSGLAGLLPAGAVDGAASVSSLAAAGSSLVAASVGREPSSVASRGVPPLLVPEQVVSFGEDGGVEGDAGRGPLGAVRLVRADEDRGVGVDLAVLSAGDAVEVSSLGFGFELMVDGVPAAAAGGNGPCQPW